MTDSSTDGHDCTVLVHPNQETKICKAYRANRGCRIQLRKAAVDPNQAGGSLNTFPAGPTYGRVLLDSIQKSKFDSAKPNEDLTLKFSHKNLESNSKMSGGFIGLIIAALASSIAGGLIERGIAGGSLETKSFLWNRGKSIYELKPHEKGVHLTPWRRHKNAKFEGGKGLYIKRGSTPIPALGADLKHLSAMHKKLIKNLIIDTLHK